MICWLAKAAGVEASGQMRDEQLHAVAAQSTFGSQNVQTIPGPDHCWKFAMSKKCTPLWREAHLHTMFGPLFEVEMSKMDAVVARSTFSSQNTSASDRRGGAKHIWKSKCTKHTMFGPLLILRCRKSARRCGAKHISRSKCTKHVSFGPLLEVAMSKKCTLLWPKHIWKSVVHGCRAHVLQRKCAGCDSACSQSAEYIL